MVKKKRTLDEILKVEKCVNVFSKESGQLLGEFQVYLSTPPQLDGAKDHEGDANLTRKTEEWQNDDQEQHEQQQLPATQQLEQLEQEGTEAMTELKFHCTSCSANFSSAIEHRLHSKMDWHRFNVRQKCSGKPILTEDMFEAMLSDDCSSISGSDSESDYENPLSHQREEEGEDSVESDINKDPLLSHPYKMFLMDPSRQLLYSLHKNIIENATNEELVIRNVKRLVTGSGIWVYAMLSAGHFAAAVFHKDQAIVHKTFHRYTVRAKQGTSQGGHDAKNREAKSAGASIRRHNEAALVNDIQELLTAWRKHISDAEKIFIKCAPAYNYVFFDDKSGSLQKDDSRVVRISLITRRPTLKEVKRLHGLYTSVYLHGPLFLIQEELARELTTESKKATKITTEKKPTLLVSSTACVGGRSRSPSPGPDPNKNPDCIALWNDTYDHCKNGDIDMLTKMLGPTDATFFISDEDNLSSMPSSEFATRDYLLTRREFFEGGYLNQCGGELAETLLHCAAKSTNCATITFLMGIGCDPATRDKRGRLPYNIASSKENRNEFRRFMGKFPSQYDYAAAQIPSPLTEEAELSKKEKEAEKKRQQNKARKQRQKAKKAEEYREKESEREKRKEADEAAKEAAEFAKLSVREKCALMAERRMADHLAKRCSNCKASIDNMVPFERFEYKYCSTDCVHTHKDVIGK